MDNETKIKLSFNNSVTGQKKIEKYEERLKNIYGLIGGLNGTETQNTMQQINKNVVSVNKNVKETSTNSIKLANNLKKAFNVAKIVAYTRTLYNLSQQLMKLSQKSVEYIENVNLLEVAYKNQNETIEESSKRIETYIDKMSEVYGLDESRLSRQFGIFKQLSNAMQLPTETAENLSEIMVKMTNDIASLYNLDLNRASNALQSALAGQVRPIRSATGADITEKTLQNTVEDIGLDRSINQLSYVEKRLVMVVSLTNQLKNSQGDYARTIESASNQIRVMHEQWDRLSRSLGNIFYPVLEKILPYVNALLMALTEIFNLIASLVGFEMPEFDYSGLTGVSDVAQDIEDELYGAGDAVDELGKKLKGLRGFDKLNVINTPSASSATSGAGASGGIDPKIMEAFNNAFANYNDMMDTVQMKAIKVRDSIMEWLGFTKEINEETGEISWKFDGTKNQLSTLLNVLKTSGEKILELFDTILFDIKVVLSSDIGKSLFENISGTFLNIIEIIGNVADAINNALNSGFGADNAGLSIFKSFYNILKNIWKIIKNITDSLKKWTLSDEFKKAISDIVQMLKDVLQIISDITDWIVDIYEEYLSPVVDNLLLLISAIIERIKAIWDVIKPIVEAIVQILKYVLEPVIANLTNKINTILKVFTDFNKFITNVFKGDWKEAWKDIQNIFQDVADYIFEKINIVSDVFHDVISKLGEAFGFFGNKIKDIFGGAWEYVTSVWDKAGDFFGGVINGIKDVFARGFQGIKDTIANVWGNITDLFSTGGDIFNGIVTGVVDVFLKIVNGLIDGINWIISQPFNAINDILKGIRDTTILKFKPFKWVDTIWVPQIPNLEFAKGGMPEVGQMFIANEKGPELVGQIGGRTFVANQNQMMDLLDKKIGNAQSSQKQVFNIYLDAEHKIGTYTLDQLEDLAKTNGSAITIGG